MPRSYRRLGYAALVLGIAFAIVVLFLYSKGLEPSSPKFWFADGVIKKLSVGQVSFEGANPNRLIANVTVVAGSDNGVITGAMVKDALGVTVAEGNAVPSVLQGQNKTTVTFNLDKRLSSGKYWLHVRVEGGGVFTSLNPFTVP